MLRNIFGLTIVFVVIASFGLVTLFTNVPTTAATGIQYFGCDGINQWAARNVTTTFGATFDFSGQAPGAVITATGTNITLRQGTSYPFPPPGVSSFTYTTTGQETLITIGVFHAGSLTSLTCAYPVVPDDGVLFHDSRLNADTPNAPVVFYATDEGIQVYWINGGLILDIDAAFLAENGDNNPVWESGNMSFWKLLSGEYQFMVGPDASGDIYVNTFDAMPPTTPKSTNISYNETGISSKW